MATTTTGPSIISVILRDGQSLKVWPINPAEEEMNDLSVLHKAFR